MPDVFDAIDALDALGELKASGKLDTLSLPSPVFIRHDGEYTSFRDMLAAVEADHVAPLWELGQRIGEGAARALEPLANAIHSAHVRMRRQGFRATAHPLAFEALWVRTDEANGDRHIYTMQDVEQGDHATLGPHYDALARQVHALLMGRGRAEALVGHMGLGHAHALLLGEALPVCRGGAPAWGAALASAADLTGGPPPRPARPWPRAMENSLGHGGPAWALQHAARLATETGHLTTWISVAGRVTIPLSRRDLVRTSALVVAPPQEAHHARRP